MKIAVVIGHNSKRRGMRRVTDGKSEFEWCGDLATSMRDAFPGVVRVFARDPALGYSRQIDKVYGECDEWGADASIELHFNGHASNASGTEMLSSGSSMSLKLAEAVQQASLDVLKLADRGVKVRSPRDRGGRSLFAGRAPAVLTEFYFGSNAGDCQVADDNMEVLAEAVVKAMIGALQG